MKWYDVLKIFLLPFSLLYGTGIWLRNKSFDYGLISSRSFATSIISIGNLTVGGTGKTPHAEYLIRLLKESFRVAVLSRGYKRKTGHFLVATENSTAFEIGDEPKQMKQKFPEVMVAVDKKRVEGIQKIMEGKNFPQVILLDDAFQHRYVKPGLSIVLTDYHRPVFNDFLLPAGRLREPLTQLKRADVVIVTKTPEDITEQVVQKYFSHLRLKPDQILFFSTYKYQEIQAVFPEAENKKWNELNDVLLVTGIANTTSLEKFLKKKNIKYTLIKFPDHHTFSHKDIRLIEKRWTRSSHNAIVTTEKDAIRFKEITPLDENLKKHFFYIPIKVDFLFHQKEMFNELILKYVGENTSSR